MGEVFAGRYELLDPIAEGGMGSVWRVRDLDDGTVKAAKLLRQSDAGSLMRFMREQSMRIDHEHVVAPLSWAGADDRVLFTMPLVRGGSVATLVGDYGPLPVSWVVTLLDQALLALEAVHEAGIVHRDVKPANLLLEPTGQDRPHLLLSDFGIAAPVGQPRLTRASMVLGSTGYTPPDQLQGWDPDPRQDIYAVAMCGLQMLTGRRPPYDDETLDQRARQPPAERSEALVAVLRDAADPNPARRPATASRMREILVERGLMQAAAGLLADARQEEIEVFDVLDHGDLEDPPADVETDDTRPGRAAVAASARRRLGAALGVVGLLFLAAALWVALGL